MPMYRRRPPVVEARRFDGSNGAELIEWCGGAARLRARDRGGVETETVEVETIEGEIPAEVGDYIIKVVDGEFHAYKPEIFEKIYEPEPVLPVTSP